MAFLLASGSSFAEPVGAAVALLFLRNQSTFPLEMVLAFVAGIMIMVELCELFQEAKRHDRPKYFATGTLTGIAIMGMTELYLP
jgi:zinc transporter ZupT